MMVSINQKGSSVKKDAICLALVVAAVFALHIFSKNTTDQLYKAKKDNTAITAPASRKASFF